MPSKRAPPAPPAVKPVRRSIGETSSATALVAPRSDPQGPQGDTTDIEFDESCRRDTCGQKYGSVGTAMRPLQVQLKWHKYNYQTKQDDRGSKGKESDGFRMLSMFREPSQRAKQGKTQEEVIEEMNQDPKSKTSHMESRTKIARGETKYRALDSEMQSAFVAEASGTFEQEYVKGHFYEIKAWIHTCGPELVCANWSLKTA